MEDESPDAGLAGGVEDAAADGRLVGMDVGADVVDSVDAARRLADLAVVQQVAFDDLRGAAARRRLPLVRAADECAHGPPVGAERPDDRPAGLAGGARDEESLARAHAMACRSRGPLDPAPPSLRQDPLPATPGGSIPGDASRLGVPGCRRQGRGVGVPDVDRVVERRVVGQEVLEVDQRSSADEIFGRTDEPPNLTAQALEDPVDRVGVGRQVAVGVQVVQCARRDGRRGARGRPRAGARRGL